MKLYLNDTSPFSRAVLATAYLCETDLELEWVDPWQSPDNLIAINAFSAVPVLVTDDSTPLVESLNICEYLIHTFPNHRLQATSATQSDRIALLGKSKILMEASFRSAALSRYDAGDNVLSVRGKEGIKRAITGLIQQLHNEPELLQHDFATLYLHVAVDYVLFRHADLLTAEQIDQLSTAFHRSPYVDTLAKLSVPKLSTKPSYSDI